MYNVYWFSQVIYVDERQMILQRELRRQALV